ncbi:putative SWI5-dependent HO expression protein [Clavispora lusitaniae]|uniref:SWI5-dependent HO expression protein n=1 Tax=Clavispora lusitaniae TaxID=36911 RepID=A0AA91SZQ0_CLALS|nr:putative SWI5-dependent HO expression protein [Clavispora lusitaniae]
MDLVPLLCEGKPLSETQFGVLKCSSDDVREKCRQALQYSPSSVLHSLEAFGSAAAAFLVSSLPGDCSALIEECEKKLDTSSSEPGPSLDLYISLYSNLCLQNDTSEPVLLLCPFLKTQYDRAVTLALVLYARKYTSKAESQAKTLVQRILNTDPDHISASEFRSLCSTIELFFPIFPQSMKALYVSARCKEIFLHQAQMLENGKGSSNSKIEWLLRVLSASCVDEGARKFNTDTYLRFLVAGTEMDSHVIRSLSLLCLVKLWNFSETEKQISFETLVQSICNGFKSCDLQDKSIEYFLESLAYLSLGNAAKKAMRDDEDFLERLLFVLETTKDPSNIYGVLLVYSNLSKSRDPTADKDTNTINYLKNIAVPGNDRAANNPEDDALFNENLVISHKLVGSLRALKVTQGNSLSQIIRIIYNLSSNHKREIQREIVAQGGLNIVLKYLTQYSSVDKKTHKTHASSMEEETLEVRLCAIRALATICRSVDPKLAFSEFDIKTTVPFLEELLGLETEEQSFQTQKDNPRAAFASSITVLDKLCSLLALTNLSSMPNKALHESIITRLFEQHLKDLMLETSQPDIQRAAWELINNLISTPMMLAKFFNSENPESIRNLNILVKMLHSKNESLQVVIAGLLANATMEFELVAQVLMENQQVFEQIMEIIANILQKQADNDDLLLRVLTFLLNLVEVAVGHKLDALDKIQNDKPLKQGLKNVVISTKNSDIMYTIRGIVEAAQLKF